MRSQANDRIATKLAHDGPQVSLHPGCAQGQGQSQRSRDTGTFVLSRKSQAPRRFAIHVNSVPSWKLGPRAYAPTSFNRNRSWVLAKVVLGVQNQQSLKRLKIERKLRLTAYIKSHMIYQLAPKCITLSDF